MLASCIIFIVQLGNTYSVSWRSGSAAVLVVLLDDDTVVCNAREGDVGVGDVRHGSGGSRVGLDADAVLGISHSAVRESDIQDSVVALASDTSDRETVSS